jgi:4a-hydroxytetrahydrobiopterin dehydratase
MTAINKLGAAAVAALRTAHPAWDVAVDGSAMTRKHKFADFSEAFAFMTRVALLAEAADHHPEWSNVYNKVDIRLTTHDVDGLSSRDVAMAQAIDRVLGS